MLSPDYVTQSLEMFSEGTAVSRFVIDRVLGTGGMGVVHRAHPVLRSALPGDPVEMTE